MEMTMEAIPCVRRDLPGERVEAIRFTSPASEPVCALCGGTGWRRAGNDDSVGLRRCACAKAASVAARLAAIPEMFRGATFESYRARNERQERAVALMRALPEGIWYMTGHYGSGKTHLFYAQYRDMAVAGRTRCHVRTTRELLEELRRMELEDEFVSPVMAAAYSCAPYHLFWDDIDKLKPTDFKTEVLFELVDARIQRGLKPIRRQLELPIPPVFDQEILDHFLLPTIHPASENQKQ